MVGSTHTFPLGSFPWAIHHVTAGRTEGLTFTFWSLQKMWASYSPQARHDSKNHDLACMFGYEINCRFNYIALDIVYTCKSADQNNVHCKVFFFFKVYWGRRMPTWTFSVSWSSCSLCKGAFASSCRINLKLFWTCCDSLSSYLIHVLFCSFKILFLKTVMKSQFRLLHSNAS